MKDEKKVKVTEEEAKKEVQTEEQGTELNEEKLEKVSGGYPDPTGEYLTFN